jgi:hypothetical protein
MSDEGAPFFPRPAHVVIGVLLAIAAVAGTVNAVRSSGIATRVLHGGIATVCVIWSVIEFGAGGRARQ